MSPFLILKILNLTMKCYLELYIPSQIEASVTL